MHENGHDQEGFASSSHGWSVADSAALYRIDEWGMGFFSIGDNGNLEVKLDAEGERVVDLYEVMRGLEDRGITAPVRIGFPDLLAARMLEMASAFSNAIAENSYQGAYTAVYPIKVNQHRALVKEIERSGRRHGFGLEVGSKPELLAVMGLTVDHPDRLIVCNGFKEERYVRHIMLATKLGRHVVAVIENISRAAAVARPRSRIRRPPSDRHSAQARRPLPPGVGTARPGTRPSSASPSRVCSRSSTASGTPACWTVWSCCTATWAASCRTSR